MKTGQAHNLPGLIFFFFLPEFRHKNSPMYSGDTKNTYFCRLPDEGVNIRSFFLAFRSKRGGLVPGVYVRRYFSYDR